MLESQEGSPTLEEIIDSYCKQSPDFKNKLWNINTMNEMNEHTYHDINRTFDN